MKSVFLVIIAAIAIAGCGNKDKPAKGSSCQANISGCRANQVVYPVNSPHAQVGLPGNYGSIIGAWCSVNSRVRFDQDGAFSMVKTDGTVRFSTYTYSAGRLIIGGTMVPAVIASESASSTALLYLTFSVGYTEVMERCDSLNQQQDGQDDKEEPEQESTPHPKPTPKATPYPTPMPTPEQKELPPPPVST